MTKSEYDTPGPFSLAGDDEFPTIHRWGVAQYLGSLDAAEREELVDLLNKGTHFEALLRVVCELLRYPEDKPPFDEAHTAFEFAMGREWDDERDKAEGEDDANQN